MLLNEPSRLRELSRELAQIFPQDDETVNFRMARDIKEGIPFRPVGVLEPLDVPQGMCFRIVIMVACH